MSEKQTPVVFQVGDNSFVDPNGNPVKADGTPIKTSTGAEGDTDLQAQVEALKKERDDLKKQLDSAQLIPADAAKRLENVKGISAELAKAGLEALTAKG